MTVNYVVTDVGLPVLSVSTLLRKGYSTTLTKNGSYLEYNNMHTPIIQIGNLFYLKIKERLPPGNIVGHTEVPTTNDNVYNQEEHTTIVAPVQHHTGPRSVTSSEADYWEIRQHPQHGALLIRVHRRPRRTLFSPDGNFSPERPLPLEDLLYKRITNVNYLDGTNESIKTTGYYHDVCWTRSGLVRHTSPSATNNTNSQRNRQLCRATNNYQDQQQDDQRRSVFYQQLPDMAEGEGEHQIERQPQPGPPKENATEDYWERQGEQWIRYHIVSRRRLYVPHGQQPNGPNPDELLDSRVTNIFYDDDNIHSEQLHDVWRRDRQYLAELDVKHTWTGTTVFTLRPLPDIDEDDPDTVKRARKGTAVNTPKQPTAQERELHNLTHLPYKTWCETCLRSKARPDRHTTTKDKDRSTPIIQVDYTYAKAANHDDQLLLLTAVDTATGLALAAVVPYKGGKDRYAIMELRRFIYECGRTTGILVSDQEPAVQELLRSVLAQVGGLSMRLSPTYSPQSKGSVERFHSTLFAQLRTLRRHILDNYGYDLPPGHPLTHWLVKHSAWLLNHFALHADDKTSYERRWGKTYRNNLCEFGETILYKPSTDKRTPKLTTTWEKGIWAGRDSESDEIYVLTPDHGALKVRSVRRLPADGKYDLDLLRRVKGTPLNPSGDGETTDVNFIFPLHYQARQQQQQEPDAAPPDNADDRRQGSRVHQV